MLVVDYQYHRPLWSLAWCISSVAVVHQAPQLGVLQSPYDLSPPSSLPPVKDLGLNKSVSKSLFPHLSWVQVGLACVAHVTSGGLHNIEVLCDRAHLTPTAQTSEDQEIIQWSDAANDPESGFSIKRHMAQLREENIDSVINVQVLHLALGVDSTET